MNAIVVSADIIPELEQGASFDRPRVLFHVQVVGDERILTSKEADVSGLENIIAEEVATQLKHKIRGYNRSDQISRELYDAFVRYRRELAEIRRRLGGEDE